MFLQGKGERGREEGVTRRRRAGYKVWGGGLVNNMSQGYRRTDLLPRLLPSCEATSHLTAQQGHGLTSQHNRVMG